MNLSHKVDPYGNKNFSYEGEGILFTKDGKKHKAEFYATQLETGESLIAFSFSNNYINFDDSSKELSIEKFLGTTKENWDIKAIAPFDAVFFNPEIPSDFFGNCDLFHSRKIEIIKTKKYTLDKYVFGITNFKFGITSNHEQKFSLEDGIDVNIKKKNNYSDIIHNLKISKGINVTAEIAIENSNDNGFDDITKIIDDLCYLLSLARGTKIQWVYCKEINKKGDICKVKHFNHVTKPYVFLEVIDVNSTMLISEFIDKTYNNYLIRGEEFNLDKGTIDAYLDARTMHDFLELRGLKVAIVLEMIVNSFSNNNKGIDNIISEDMYNSIAEELKICFKNKLEDLNLNSNEIQAFTGKNKLKQLNRRSFISLIKKLFKYIKLDFDYKEINLFKKSRNHLVHQGKFYSQVNFGGTPFSDPTEEYFFMINMLDKILLKIIGYSGEYIDWSTPANPKKCYLE